MRPSDLTFVLSLALGCANVNVPLAALPPETSAGAFGARSVILVLDEAPRPMAEEMRMFAADAGREVSLNGDASLASLCPDAATLVMRPRHQRTHFASNAPDRNTLMLYEGLVIVGIPIALGSAVAWKWYAETVVSGELEVTACAGDRAESALTYVESFRIRSEGRGFVRTTPLREGQLEGALRGLTRELLGQAVRSS